MSWVIFYSFFVYSNTNSRLLYAKKDWHKEYNKDGNVQNNQSIKKLDDLKDNLNEIDVGFNF